jgi:hypothetical protein
MAGHGAEECAFSDATASKQTDPLAFAARKKAVDGPDSGGETLTDRLPFQWARRRMEQAVISLRFDGPLVVDGSSSAIEYAAQETPADGGAGVFAAGHNRIAQLQTIGFL